MANAPHGKPPLIVTAPTARNGVTLLQRLLNSTRKIIVYGENKHFCEMVPQTLFVARDVHTRLRKNVDEARARFLNETTEFWSSTLWPDTAAYLQAAAEGFGHLLRCYHADAAGHGFSQWGIKHPFETVAALMRFLQLMPGARYLYIYRNPYDVLRSAKARGFVHATEDARKLATTWAESVRTIRQLRADNLLILRHEDLVANSETWISRIESFTGVGPIDPSVMTRRFNTFEGPESAGCSPTQYIAPKELTADESAIIHEACGVLLEQEGYVDASADCPA